MEIRIISEKFQLDIYGFGGKATNKDYVGAVFKLSGKVWEVVKANDIKNKGRNIWVYEADDRVFAGVELESPTDNIRLEKMSVDLNNYAYFKHIGTYNLIKQAGQNMTNELTRQGFRIIPPYIEIYGHWTSDESKLETELIMCFR